jgi:pyruvate,water dikinase
VLLTGTAASPGLAVGPASLVLSDRDLDAVKPGGILVCRSTGPSWTPLFGVVAGVVTDVGGPLSHAAIVAREYGIPAVIGTGNATSMLRPDRVYAVDGSAGEVRIGCRPR